MSALNRRQFIGRAGTRAALTQSSMAGYPAVSIVVHPADPVANSTAPKWAAQKLERSLKDAGSTLERRHTLPEATGGNQCVAVAESRSPVAQGLQKLEYYFELKQGAASAWLYPGFATDLHNQPYFVVRRG